MASKIRQFGYPVFASIVLVLAFCLLTGSGQLAEGLLLAAAVVVAGVLLTAPSAATKQRRGLGGPARR